MEKKPIKRSGHIIKLSRDHHASLMFCWKLRQGIKYHISIDRMIKYVHYFWNQHFSLHFKEEEEVLFAPLKDDKIQKAIDEHIKIKATIHELKFPGSETQRDQLSALADVVDDHVRYEERILFPHLETALTEQQLEKIGSQISSDTLLDTYEDDFWTKPKSL